MSAPSAPGIFCAAERTIRLPCSRRRLFNPPFNVADNPLYERDIGVDETSTRPTPSREQASLRRFAERGFQT